MRLQKKVAFILISFFLLQGCEASDITSQQAKNAESVMFGKNKTKSYVIFSPMDGVLMQNGNPLAKMKIIRRLKWNGNDVGLVDEFFTDDQGRFSLPVHEEELSLGMLDQFVGKAYLYVNIENDDSLIWYSPKLQPEKYSESGGPLKELVCDIDMNEIVVNTPFSNILTKCHWHNMLV